MSEPQRQSQPPTTESRWECLKKSCFLGGKKSFFLTLEHKCVKHIHLKLIWFKLKALLCNELRNPTSSIKIKPSQAAMCSYLSIFICHGLFTGIKSKTMETHRRENIQKCVHGPWQGHSSNMDFSKHRLYKRRSQILSSFITHAFSAVVCRSWNAVWGLWLPSEIIWLVCFLKINVPYGTSLGSNWKTAEELFEPTQPWNRPVLFQRPHQNFPILLATFQGALLNNWQSNLHYKRANMKGFKQNVSMLSG